MNAAGEHVRRVALAQIVEPDARQRLRQAEDADEFMGQTIGLQDSAVLFRDDRQLIVETDADLEKFVGLARAMAP
jgi:hypothetical protein